MATRFYFPEGVAAPVAPPAAGAEWEHATNATTGPALLVPDASALSSDVYQPDGADDITNKDALHRQYVTDTLVEQTISGTVTGQFQCAEDHANNNLFITVKVTAISADGLTTKATLLAITRATSLETTTTVTNRTFPSSALTSTPVANGDRLCFEIGLGGNITTATGGVQGHNGTIRWGGVASSGDLAVNETETGTTFRPWLELSGNLSFGPPTAGAVGASGAFAPLGGW